MQNCFFRCRFALIILLIASGTAVAQSQPQSLPKDSPTETPNSAANLLQKDSRLSIKVSFSRKAISLATLIRTLSRQSGVSLRVQDEELAQASLSLSVHDVPLRNVMEAPALLFYGKWTRDVQGDYTLVPQQDWRATFGPKTPAEKELAIAGQAFLKEMQKIPIEQQQRLFKPYATSVGELSPEMQRLARIVLQKANQGIEARGLVSPVSMDEFPSASICIQGGVQNVFTSYNISFGSERGGLGGSFVIPRADSPGSRNSKRGGKSTSGSSKFGTASAPPPNTLEEYAPEWPPATTQTTDYPRLEQKVTVALKDATLHDALNELAAQAPFSFITIGKERFFKRITLSVEDKPLQEALDLLMQHYTDQKVDVEWRHRGAGLIVVRVQ